jgi:hypothetical protein
LSDGHLKRGTTLLFSAVDEERILRSQLKKERANG